MNRIILFVFLLFTVQFRMMADRYTDLSQNIYEWLKVGQADSILAHSSTQIKAALTPQMIQSLWSQLIMQGGDLQQEEDWTPTVMQGYEIRQKLLVFERITLHLNVVFNQELQMEGINFTPAPRPDQPTSKPEENADTLNVTERPFVVKHGQIELQGTLTLPANCTSHLPAVLLVQGSGASDRDESVGPNKPFRDLARALAHKGIAVARYDKRTYVYGINTLEKSNGLLTYRSETSDDAAEAIKALCEVPEVDAKRVFVLGHSLGGTCLPLIVESVEVKPAGIIGMAALSRPFWEALHDQLTYIYGNNKEIIGQAEKQTRDNLPQEYLDFIESYKPLEEIAKFKQMPMLFLQGGHDYQVTKADFELWQGALANNSKAEFRFFPNLDHLFRHLPQMATPADYTQALPIDNEAIDAIANFISNN